MILQFMPWRCSACCMGFPAKLPLLQHLVMHEHCHFAKLIVQFAYGAFMHSKQLVLKMNPTPDLLGGKANLVSFAFFKRNMTYISWFLKNTKIRCSSKDSHPQYYSKEVTSRTG